MNRLGPILLLGAACVAPAHVGAAQPIAPAAAKDQARGEYELGVAAFRAHQYDEALGRFEAAYQLDPSPVLLFNLGRVHEERGDLGRAIGHFERYLLRVPDARDRAETEARLTRLRAAQAAQPSTDGVPPWVALSAIGLAVVGISTGLVFFASAKDAYEEADGVPPTAAGRARFDDLERRFERDRALGWAGVGVGVALGATGAALLLWGDGDSPSAIRLAPSVGGAVLSGAF